MKKEELKNIISLIISIFNIPLLWYVNYKVYTYFYKEVGFYLPELTLLNIIAICVLLSIIKRKNVKESLDLNDIKKKLNINKSDIFVSINELGFILRYWFMSYLIKIIIF